jgi:hypothetical protein
LETDRRGSSAGRDLPFASLASGLIETVDHEQGQWVEQFFQGKDGVLPAGRVPFLARPSGPAIEVLARRGVRAARLWTVLHVKPRDEEEKASLRLHLDVLGSEGLEPEDLQLLALRISWPLSTLGPEFVEPRVRALFECAPEAARPRFLFCLGDAMCACAQNEAERERGRAVLRSVCERWPSSADARRAAVELSQPVGR